MKNYLKGKLIGGAGCSRAKRNWWVFLLVLPFLLVQPLRAEPGLAALRLYYQVDRALPIRVEVGAAEKAELVLLDYANKIVDRVEIKAESGTVDLAEKFPAIFEFTEVRYAQLLLDEVAVGSALCLQPLVTRPTPVLRYSGPGNTGNPRVEGWQEPPAANLVRSGFRVYVESFVTLHTSAGDVVLGMRPDEAPNTVWNFLHLVKNGFYTMIPFHRVVALGGNGQPFVIQAGDPSGTGSGGCAYNIDLEPTKLPHDFGVISMARQGNDVNTGSSQFFLCLSRDGTKFLDGQYTSFGQTVEGGEVIRKLAAVPVDQRDRPREMIYILSAELTAASPRVAGVVPAWRGLPEDSDGGEVERQNVER